MYDRYEQRAFKANNNNDYTNTNTNINTNTNTHINTQHINTSTYNDRPNLFR